MLTLPRCLLPVRRPACLPTAGAQAALPDERIQDVISDMRPALRASDYSAAVERGVVDIGLGLAGGRPKGALGSGVLEAFY